MQNKKIEYRNEEHMNENKKNSNEQKIHGWPEFLKAGIPGSRIPDIFWKESGHFKVPMSFLDYISEI